ncbi:calcium/sodium antiporter [Pyrococcus abyssi]|uniref:Na+/Ca+ exchanging protein related n=1 Tax=Pyrococcus abyssi (strain GE5 / Orsay) TaxID=272844 RepID=Q9UYE7_PYRAB|nr:calcium/sodium antiporter [Pyrococcus abyssi]CAB50465.1 Na+/Ca2+ exchange integral membrane protein [Pyrococcus abyssi GE5]CCE71015.1 TPA: Na+/Ca+ exchanging protein related [Pyrococcus abyssi GE5]
MEVAIVTAVFILGLILLIKGSDIFVNAATRIAETFGVSEFLIALVLASIATTLPEATVSAISSYKGNSGIALGNAVGSALANIALILGISAMITPLKVDEVANENSLIMLGVTLYAWLLMINGEISRIEGLTLVLIYGAFLYYLYRKHVKLEEIEEESRGNVIKDIAILFLSGGMVILGAELVVDSAVKIARGAGIPEVVIGVTLVSIGTSLPELANSLTAALKGIHNVSVGNIIGADIIDILMVIGIASIIRPIKVDPSIVKVTMPITVLVMAILTVSLFRNNKVGRKTAVTLLLVYSIFLYLLAQGKVYIPG